MNSSRIMAIAALKSLPTNSLEINSPSFCSTAISFNCASASTFRISASFFLSPVPGLLAAGRQFLSFRFNNQISISASGHSFAFASPGIPLDRHDCLTVLLLKPNTRAIEAAESTVQSRSHALIAGSSISDGEHFKKACTARASSFCCSMVRFKVVVENQPNFLR